MKELNILIVDDVAKNIQVVANLLKDEDYCLSYAMAGEQAIEILKKKTYDLILLDIMMPGMNGYDTCKVIKKLPGYAEVPIIFLSAKNDQDSIILGLEAGGQDYVAKPFNSSELLARVRTHLKLRAFEKYQQEQIDKAVKEVKSLYLELEDTQREIVFTMGAIAETRSKETGLHVKRVAEYSKLLALLSGVSERDADYLALASPMHDIGKVGIPDSILNKPGRLTPEERVIMDTHAELGYEMLKHSNRMVLKTAAIIALEHHEKWDGKGYPKQLKGEEIHLWGRITALADVFDALCSKRCYKKAWADEDIFNLIKAERGKHFDPKLVDLFFDNLNDFLSIRAEFTDLLLDG